MVTRPDIFTDPVVDYEDELVAVIRHDARNLPLEDESVDLICTSPPGAARALYADVVQFLGVKIQRVKFIGHMLRSSRPSSAGTPCFQIGLCDPYQASITNERDRPVTHRLTNRFIRVAGSVGSFLSRYGGFARHESGYTKRAFSACIDSSNRESIISLGAFDAKEGSQRDQHPYRCRRMNTPRPQGATSLGVRALLVSMASECIVEQINGSGFDLFYLDTGLVSVLPAVFVVSNCDADVSVRIDHSSKVRVNSIVHTVEYTQ